MSSHQSVSATLKRLQTIPEILDDVRAGTVAAEESDFEEAIRRSLIADYDVIPTTAAEINSEPNPAAEEIESEADAIQSNQASSFPDVPEIALPLRRSRRVPQSFTTGCSDTRYERKTVANDPNSDTNNNNKLAGGGSKRKSPSSSTDEPSMKTKKKAEDRWAWISGLNDYRDISERHLYQTYCFDFPRCKRQPRCLRGTSPFCLHNLGEQRWEGIDEAHWTDELEDDVTPRCQAKWVGLENLGGTCYINSCLQLWFHNPTIRNLIFRWKEDEDVAAAAKKNADDRDAVSAAAAAAETKAVNDVDDAHQTVAHSSSSFHGAAKFSNMISHIQYVFASMLNSLNGVVSVQPLVEYLNIDPLIQQDFEEFSSLLRERIEQRTETQSDPLVRRMMQDQFQGETAKTITCSKCNNSFQSSDKFYELILTIQGKKDLYECLDSKFASEKMEGSNRYECRHCGLQDATLTYSLTSTPPMLCIQFMRFGFEGVRQKVTDCIRFPEHLLLEKYLKKKSGGEEAARASSSSSSSSTTGGGVAEYELVSVLIHMGHSSTSGHYIDCIKEYGEDATSSMPSWYTFNDNVVQGPFSKLNLSEAEQETKSKGKIPAGYHASSNAYILWYRRRDGASSSLASSSSTSAATSSSTSSSATSSSTSSSASSSTSTSTSSSSIPSVVYLQSALAVPPDWPVDVPPAIRKAVENDNAAFVTAYEQSEEAKVHSASMGKARQQFLLETHGALFLDPDEDLISIQEKDNFEFVSKNWLKKGLFEADKEEQVEKINNVPLACPHNKLDPNKVHHVKIVSKASADTFYERYQFEGPRFSSKDAMCKECVSNYCRKTQWKANVKEVQATFKKLLSNYKPDGETGRWVGSRSYRQWPQLASVPVLGGEVFDLPAEAEADEAASLAPPPDAAPAVSASTVVDSKPAKPPAPSKVAVFNEDLLCSRHGRLEPQKSVRRLIPVAVWDILKTYFPEAEEFAENAAPCPDCDLDDKEDKEAALKVKRVAGDLKRHLAEFLRGDNRPDLRLIHGGMRDNPTKPSSDTLHVIPRHFATQLQRFVKSPATDNQPVSMSAILLLCEHQKMMYNLEAQLILDSSVDLVWPHEYRVLEKNVEPEARPRVTVTFVNGIRGSEAEEMADNGDDGLHPPPPPPPPRLVYDPPLCLECSEKKLEEKKRQMFEFSEQKIIVRKLGDRDADLKLDEDDDAYKVGSAGGGGAGTSANGFGNYENDPEFQPGLFVDGKSATSISAAGKKRVSDASSAAEDGPANSKKLRSESPFSSSSSSTNGERDSALRCNGDHSSNVTESLLLKGLPTSFGPRSMAPSSVRPRKRRNDREIIVSSSDTLKDLKKKICAQFQIMPIDQNLLLDESKEKLVGDEKTLGELGVTPDCLILVRGDKPISGALTAMGAVDVKEEEQAGQAGFFGTRLCNGGSG